MRSPLRRSARPRRAFGRRDDGFTLIETVVALGIATAVFLALAAAAMTGLRASLTSQQNQQAGDVLTQTVEQLRDMTYGKDGLQISSSDPDLASDGALTSCGSASGYCFDPQLGSGAEALQVSSTGQVAKHKQTVTTNKYTYTVWIYLTRPGPVTAPNDGYGADYERVTVVARWTTYGKVHTRRVSSTLTDTLRGLPLPRFKLSAVGEQNQTVNPSAEVVFGFKVQNLGARDCWNMSSSDSGFTFYLDGDTDGFYDEDTDPLLGACIAANSALLEPTKSAVVFAVKDLSGTPGVYTQSPTFTATSWAQPTAATAKQTLTDSYTVVNGVVTPTPSPTSTTPGGTTPTPTPTTAPPTTPAGTPTPSVCADFVSGAVQPSVPKNYSAIGYWLHNAFPNTADTTALATLGLDRTAPVSTWLYDYATNVAAATPGRYLQPGGSGATETNATKVADFRIQVNQAFLSGTAAFAAWAMPANGNANTHGTLNVYLNAISPTGTVTPLSSATFDATTWGCAGFRKFGVPLTMSGATKLTTNSWIDVRVEVAGTSPMILAYDTTTFPATFAVPEK